MSNPAIAQYKDSVFVRQNDLENNLAVQTTYAFTNENLRQYIDLLSIVGGRVATAGSSGDQAFYSVFKDAEEVTLIDGSPYAKPMVELKRSAIKNMSYDEFFDYWSNENILNVHDTPHLLGDVSRQSREFFLFLLRQMDRLGDYSRNVVRSVVKEHTFKDMFDDMSHMHFKNCCRFYDTETTYNILKNKLAYAKINYALAEYNQFPKVLTGKYSTIMLSNIFDYVDQEDYFRVANRLAQDNLENGGTMQMHYEMANCPTFNAKKYGTVWEDKKINSYLVHNPVMERQKRFWGVDKRSYPKRVNEPKWLNRSEDLVYIYNKEM